MLRLSTKTVIDWKNQSKNTDLKPRITLRDDKGNVIKADDNEARYYLVPNSILSVKDGQKIFAGDVIARLPKETSKTKDITVVYQELQNFSRQEKLKTAQSLQKIMEKLFLVKKLEENKEFQLFLMMEFHQTI